ncbi:MAG: ferredoxin--NADP reductase [Neisseriales bacterium]|nr:MAG: ferredoxin--NADP reductase [Neisseriales bacterium]
MQNMFLEKVLSIHHWNSTLFSFTTTRDPALRFENGQFIMIGLPIEGHSIMRAYSIVSANYEEFLEFYSIKVPDGPLTSRLQHLKVDDQIIVSKKPTGTLVISDLRPGRNLYLLSTGTGLAPFLSIIKDPETYERFDKIILTHGVRYKSELAYEKLITEELPQHEYLGDMVRNQLIYYPTVTRESFHHQGRLSILMTSGQLFKDIQLPPIDPKQDRAMICGSQEVLKDCTTILDQLGMEASMKIGDQRDYVIERAFVEK